MARNRTCGCIRAAILPALSLVLLLTLSLILRADSPLVATFIDVGQGNSCWLHLRNAIAILMGVELMLNAVNINLVAFWRYLEPEGATGQAFVLFVYAVAAAEAAVGLALIIAVWRTRDTVVLEDIDLLKG